jgi:molecular chaperone DnaK
VAFTVCKDEDGFAVLVLPGDKKKTNDSYQEQDQIVYPEEISSHVLAKLLTSVEAHTGRTPTRAVISVPAYFNDTQREATMAAGRLAGLEKIKIIREPVAAALAYGLDVLKDETVLVFDLGGGTFDVSLLELGGGVIEVLSNGGDPHLGGDDWDASIVEWLVEKYLKPARVDVAGSPAMKANLRAAAEAAKIGLSSRGNVVIRMPVGNSGGIEAELSRQTFEGLTVELFRRARLPLDQACWQAGVDLGTAVREFEEAQRELVNRGSGVINIGGSEGGGGRSKRKRKRTIKGAKSSPAPQVQIRPKRRMPVGQVLLVGGATRMPAVQRFVKNMTGIDPKEFVVDPDLAVALGAAVQAGVYEGDLPDVMVMEVWQATLMRAFAEQLEKRKVKEEGEGEGIKEDGDDDEEEEEEEEEWDDKE